MFPLEEKKWIEGWRQESILEKRTETQSRGKEREREKEGKQAKHSEERIVKRESLSLLTGERKERERVNETRSLTFTHSHVAGGGERGKSHSDRNMYIRVCERETCNQREGKRGDTLLLHRCCGGRHECSQSGS